MNKDKPFLYLLNNIDKIDIDEELIPLFKEMLEKFQVYFEEHDLLGSRDYIYLFDKYLINDSFDKIKVTLSEDMQTAYYTRNKKLVINNSQLTLHRLSHEFIHFLVWTTIVDSKEKYDNEEVETFLDEGATEKLARSISLYKPNQNISTYNDNVEFIDFLEKLCGEKEFYSLFLSGKSLVQTFFKDDENMHTYLIVLSLLKNYEYTVDFYKNNPNLNIDNSDNLFKELEIELVKYILENKDFKCDSIFDLVEITKLLRGRPVECKDIINTFFIRLTKRILPNINFIDELKFGGKIIEILDIYSTLYTYNDGNFVEINLYNKSNSNDYITVKLDNEFNVIKSDLDIFKAGTIHQIKLIAYENSNSKERDCYTSELINVKDLDFSVSRNLLLERLNALMDELFSYDDNLSRLIVEQLIMEFYNIDLDMFIDSTLDTEILEDNLEPLLYNRVCNFIDERKNSKRI